MGCQVEIADKIVERKVDFLLALKGNQSTLETRLFIASQKVDWIKAATSYPGQPRFKNIRTIMKGINRTEYRDRCTFDERLFIASAALDPQLPPEKILDRLADGTRKHWGVESMRWLLDVVFKDDLSRYRTGFGAKNMAIIRRFALNLIRANKANGSLKTKRKSASWDMDFLLDILQFTNR